MVVHLFLEDSPAVQVRIRLFQNHGSHYFPMTTWTAVQGNNAARVSSTPMATKRMRTEVKRLRHCQKRARTALACRCSCREQQKAEDIPAEKNHQQQRYKCEVVGTSGARFSQIEPSTSCWGYSTPTIWVDERGEYLPICATTNGLNDGIMTLAPAICAALSCEPSVRNWGTTPLANVAAYGLDFVEMPSCTSNSDPETCTPGAVVTCNLSTIGLVNCIS
eukprot:TRINITY_DN67478_c3_g2_i8.p1 TRINITY_DN67478_c3_g2~~TRINITY_DN67478_c3_g2_i8.p1  ORF type:complete len:220 (+),score=10.26 TRINITY_DN67478_c3_g2_i8:41-700(+)